MYFSTHVDYPSYQVLPNGSVYRDGKILKPHINSIGRLRVDLYKNSERTRFQVHRLVAHCYIPNPDNLPEINHKDGNPLNNCIENLEWVTRAQNIQHSYDELGRKAPIGWDNGRAEYSDDIILDMRHRAKQGESYKSIARGIGCSAWYVSTVVRGKARRILGNAKAR